jgi:phage terminase large subunit
MAALGAAFPDARVPYYAPTRDDARDIMWQMLKKVCEPIFADDPNESRLEISIKNKYGGTSLLVLYGWEAVQERGKGVGVKNNHIFLDEVAKYKNFWQGWQEILRPTLTDLSGGATFISTPNGFNHFYDLFNLEGVDPDYKSFHFTSYDNPHLPKEEIEKAKQELTEDRFAQEYLGDFRKTEGLVYKEFSRDRHVFDENVTIAARERIAGVDFGYTNPAAIPFITIDLEGHYWVTDEYYRTGKTEAEIGEFVANQKFQRVYPDPESPSAIEEMRRRGVNVRDVIKNKDSIKSGIQVIRELLKSGRLHISKKCINLISEFETYCYPDKKDFHNEDELPIKEHDHLLDALRYAVSSNESARPQKASIYTPQSFLNVSPHNAMMQEKKASVYIPTFKKR